MTAEERRAIEERMDRRSAPATSSWVEQYPVIVAVHLRDAEADRAALLLALRGAEATIARQHRVIYRLVALVHRWLAAWSRGACRGLGWRGHTDARDRIRARLAKLEGEKP